MTTTTENYKGYTLEKRIDVKSHTCLIYKGGELIKCVAGAIYPDGSEDSIKKAKNWIDQKK